MPRAAEKGSRRQIAERRRTHIRNLAKLGIDDYGLAEQLTKETGQYVTPTVARNLMRSILDEAINGSLDREQERQLMIMQLDSHIQFCLSKAREINQEGTKGKITWQKETRSLLNQKAKLLGLDQPTKEIINNITDESPPDTQYVTPKGMTLEKSYPWMLTQNPEQSNKIHQKFLEQGLDRKQITDAEFTDSEQRELYT